MTLIDRLVILVIKFKLSLAKNRGYARMLVTDIDLEVPVIKSDISVRRRLLAESLKADGHKVTTGSMNNLRYIEIAIPRT